jgi:hypothetical protein
MTCSTQASSSFRLITGLRLRGHWRISCRQIKDTRPSKLTTSNVRFWQRLPTLSAMATSISWGAPRVALSPFGARWILRAPSAGGMRTRDHISKQSSAFPGPPIFATTTANPGHIPQDALTRFENDLDNYVNLLPQTDCAHDPNQKLAHASPEWLVTNGATSNPPAIRLYATQGDPVPNSQAEDMFQALITHYGNTFDVQRWIMNYPYGDPHDHAYKYWHAINNAQGSDGLCVSQEVISFLQSHL